MAKDVKYRERKVVVKFGVGPPRSTRKQTGGHSFLSYHSGIIIYHSLISGILAPDRGLVVCSHAGSGKKGVNSSQ
jgi:hypothetical protein